MFWKYSDGRSTVKSRVLLLLSRANRKWLDGRKRNYTICFTHVWQNAANISIFFTEGPETAVLHICCIDTKRHSEYQCFLFIEVQNSCKTHHMTLERTESSKSLIPVWAAGMNKMIRSPWCRWTDLAANNNVWKLCCCAQGPPPRMYLNISPQGSHGRVRGNRDVFLVEV